MRRAFGVGLLAALGSCSGDAASPLPVHAVSGALEPLGVQTRAARTQVVTLAYQAPPADCPHVYRITVDNEPELLHEGDTVSFLAMSLPAGGPLTPGATARLVASYRGFRAERTGLVREAHISALHAGPSSPTAGCLPQTWDPVEDAMTLGWPKLTGRLTALHERWTGLRVAGRCNRAACIDPATGGGGPKNHHRTCVTQDWQNELVGILTADHGRDPERLALIHSTWTDGQEPAGAENTTGIWSIRTALLSVDHGRPVWVRHRLHHGYPRPTADGSWAPIDRTWELHSADACPGSLASYGWKRPQEVLDGVPPLDAEPPSTYP